MTTEVLVTYDFYKDMPRMSEEVSVGQFVQHYGGGLANETYRVNSVPAEIPFDVINVLNGAAHAVSVGRGDL